MVEKPHYRQPQDHTGIPNRDLQKKIFSLFQTWEHSYELTILSKICLFCSTESIRKKRTPHQIFKVTGSSILFLERMYFWIMPKNCMTGYSPSRAQSAILFVSKKQYHPLERWLYIWFILFAHNAILPVYIYETTVNTRLASQA